MHIRDYFPLGVARGKAFCNRVEETHVLSENIKSGKHTLLMAPRRYGKSSLALHALQLTKLPFVEVDFYMARNEKVIEKYVLNAVIELIGKSLGSLDKLLASIKKYVKSLKPKVDIGGAVLKLELTTELESDPALNVKEGLQLLERLLEEKKTRAVLLLDEFQNVGVIAKGSGMEAAIRHVAQKTKYLTIVFSGSNRKLLKVMFDDENRPLYKLCWKITLKKISEAHYHKHIQKIAKQIWNKEFRDETMQAIFNLTERHPYYVNKLCDRLLVYFKQSLPGIKDVNHAWNFLLEEEKSDVIKELSLLSSGQKSVLIQIAKGVSNHLTSKQMIVDLHMNSSSILSALSALDEKDIVEKIDEHYYVINPVVKYYALKNE